jgi:hypothetical protein
MLSFEESCFKKSGGTPYKVARFIAYLIIRGAKINKKRRDHMLESLYL